jgi:hypothetical protein
MGISNATAKWANPEAGRRAERDLCIRPSDGSIRLMASLGQLARTGAISTAGHSSSNILWADFQ